MKAYLVPDSARVEVSFVIAAAMLLVGVVEFFRSRKYKEVRDCTVLAWKDSTITISYIKDGIEVTKDIKSPAGANESTHIVGSQSKIYVNPDNEDEVIFVKGRYWIWFCTAGFSVFVGIVLALFEAWS